jgi:transketolase
MLQYALLHLYGYALTLDDLKAFRVGFPLSPLRWGVS